MAGTKEDLEATRVSSLGELQERLAARQARGRAHLIVLSGENIHEMHRIDNPEVVLGRGANASVHLRDDGISRRHARIVQEDNEVFVEDLQSANGTFVNGERITRRALRDGDRILLGSTTILKFTSDELEENFQEKMYEAALRDGLTKAYNKRYFLERIENELAFARRHATTLSLVLFDVDHFKRINDTFGHIAGDHALTHLASLAQSTIRSEDVFARVGGEEFAVLCRGVTLSQAGILAERIRAHVERSPLTYEAVQIPLTVSLGVSAFPDSPAERPEQLVAAADEALYEAKRTGRNRVLLRYPQA